MNHIFLTGEIQVGKSTIIKRIFSEIDVIPQGFNTVSIDSEDKSINHLYLLPYGSTIPLISDRPFAERNMLLRKKVGYTDVFNEEGVEILRNSQENQNTEVIVMDELGFFESEAYRFQDEVFRCLDGDIPVIGVIKPQETDFLNQVRTHDKVDVVKITVENRDEIYTVLSKIIKTAFQHNNMEAANVRWSRLKMQ